jgi:hypothetical protein
MLGFLPCHVNVMSPCCHVRVSYSHTCRAGRQTLDRWRLPPPGEAGKYFGGFLRESPPKLAVVSRSSKCRKRRIFRVNRNCRQLSVLPFVQLLTGGL